MHSATASLQTEESPLLRFAGTGGKSLACVSGPTRQTLCVLV